MRFSVPPPVILLACALSSGRQSTMCSVVAAHALRSCSSTAQCVCQMRMLLGGAMCRVTHLVVFGTRGGATEEPHQLNEQNTQTTTLVRCDAKTKNATSHRLRATRQGGARDGVAPRQHGQPALGAKRSASAQRIVCQRGCSGNESVTESSDECVARLPGTTNR